MQIDRVETETVKKERKIILKDKNLDIEIDISQVNGKVDHTSVTINKDKWMMTDSGRSRFDMDDTSECMYLTIVELQALKNLILSAEQELKDNGIEFK